MRHFRAKQSKAQFLQETVQSESEAFMTRGSSETVHSEFLLSLRAMPFITVPSYSIPGGK